MTETDEFAVTLARIGHFRLAAQDTSTKPGYGPDAISTKANPLASACNPSPIQCLAHSECCLAYGRVDHTSAMVAPQNTAPP